MKISFNSHTMPISRLAIAVNIIEIIVVKKECNMAIFNLIGKGLTQMKRGGGGEKRAINSDKGMNEQTNQMTIRIIDITGEKTLRYTR